MAKLLLQPYLLCLIVPIGTLFWILIKYRRLISRDLLRLLWISIILLISIIMLSTPIVSSLIEISLYVKPSINNTEPDVIAVLGGSYSVNTLEELDVLTPASIIRVLEGVIWWKNNQSAILVMCGAEKIKGRLASRCAFLMMRLAEIEGVPQNKIFADTLSFNTWEHPKILSELPIIKSNDVIGVVTSRWHMRRALWSFKKFFDNVQPSPVQSSISFSPKFHFYNFIPHPSAMSRTTVMIHEWIGLLWYKLNYLIN